MIGIKSYSKNKTTSGLGGSSSKSGGSYLSTIAAAAYKLVNTHYIWGHEFNGTQDVDGDLEVPNLVVDETAKVGTSLDVGTTLSVGDDATFGGKVSFNGGGYVSEHSSLYIPSSSTDGSNTYNTTTYLGSKTVKIGCDTDVDNSKVYIWGETQHKGDVVPYLVNGNTNVSDYSLGQDTKRWKNLYCNDAFLKNLTVTGSAHFFELIIDKIKSVGGAVLFTPCDGFEVDIVESVSTGYKLYWRSDDNGKRRISQWMVGDQALCRNFNQAKVGTSYNVDNKYYWCLVTEVSDSQKPTTIDGLNYNYIVISKTDCDGTVNPEAGDNIVMCGYRGTDDIARQSAIYISAYDSLDSSLKAPLFAHYQGINDFNLEKHRKTYWDSVGAKFVGDFEVSSATSLQNYIAQQITAIQNYVDKKMSDVDVTIPYIRIEGTTNGTATVNIHNGKTLNTLSITNTGITYLAVKRSDLTVAEQYTVNVAYSSQASTLMQNLLNKMAEYNDAYFAILVSNTTTSMNDNFISTLKTYGGTSFDAYANYSYPLAFIGINGVGEGNGIEVIKTDSDATALIATYIVDGWYEANGGVYFKIDQLNNSLSSRISTVEGNVSTVQQKADSLTTSVSNIGNSMSSVIQTSNNISQEITDLKTGLTKAGINIDGSTSTVNVYGSLYCRNGNGVYIQDSSNTTRVQVTANSIGDYNAQTSSSETTYTSPSEYIAVTSTNNSNVVSGYSNQMIIPTSEITTDGATLVTINDLKITNLSYYLSTNYYYSGNTSTDHKASTFSGGQLFVELYTHNKTTDTKTIMCSWKLGQPYDTTVNLSLTDVTSGTFSPSFVPSDTCDYLILKIYCASIGLKAQDGTSTTWHCAAFRCGLQYTARVTYNDTSVSMMGYDGLYFNTGTNQHLYYGPDKGVIRWKDTTLVGNNSRNMIGISQNGYPYDVGPIGAVRKVYTHTNSNEYVTVSNQYDTYVMKASSSIYLPIGQNKVSGLGNLYSIPDGFVATIIPDRSSISSITVRCGLYAIDYDGSRVMEMTINKPAAFMFISYGTSQSDYHWYRLY